MKLFIRTDASVSIGTGHVMRCLALAQAWQGEGGHATFLMAETTPSVEARLQKEGMNLIPIKASPGSERDANQTADIVSNNRADWVVVDGYRFGAGFQQVIKNSGQKLLFLDDNGHAEGYPADLVLNPNLHAQESFYANRSPNTRLLLGTRYAMLRREFTNRRGWAREVAPVPHHMLVSLGGSDPQNITQLVIEALQELSADDLKITVIVGGSNPHLDLLNQLISRSTAQIQLVSNPGNMAELMASADFAISGAGSTCWEMCCVGLPAIVIDVAPNQTLLARALDHAGAAIHLPMESFVSQTLAQHVRRFIDSPELLRSLSARARQLVDGNGSARVLAAMKHEIRLRRTEPGDCRLLWEWANDPQVRAMSFSTGPIPWERHVEWFRSQLEDESARLYVASDGSDRLIGQVRYQLGGDRAALSLNLGPEFREKGYGKAMLLLATEDLFGSSQVRTIDAFVKPCNTKSLRLFEAAGFSNQGIEVVQGQQAVHFVMSRTFL